MNKLLILVFVTSAFALSSFSIPEKLPPSATITGSTQVCLNDTPPVITFTGSGGNAPYTFTYTINSGANITASTGNNSNTVSVNVPTNTAGTFIYALVSVQDGNSNTSNANGTATVVVSNPSVSFTFNNNNSCSGTTIQFTSNVSGNGNFTYLWNFGDGSTSTNQNPNHVFSAFGCTGVHDYTVSLTVTDTYGCSNSFSQVVTVLNKPELSFVDLDTQFGDPFDNCGNNTSDPTFVVNVGNTSPSASCITSYSVDWGDGTTESNVTFPATHTYTELGSFDMVITGTGANCTGQVSYLVKNSSNPIGAIINPGNTVNLCIPVNALNFAIGAWGTNPPDTTYSVDFGDGSTEFYTQTELEASTYFNSSDPAASQNFPIPHVYTESNCPSSSYIVYLEINTSCGQTQLTAGPIIILKKPEVDFEVDAIACVNTTVLFDNTTVDGYNQNCNTDAVYNWDFGDGTTSTLEDPSHVYTSPGTYTISMYAQNFCGTTNTVTKTICIEPPLQPTFNLTNDNGCSPFVVSPANTTDLSQSCDAPTYNWTVNYIATTCGSESYTFINGTDETSANPQISFNSAGEYELILEATNSCGTEISTVQTIIVKDPPEVTLSSIDDACGASTITPTATVNTCAPTSETITYLWSFPNGTPATSTSLDPGTITYATSGTHTITFSVTNSCGTTTESIQFTNSPTPIISSTNADQSICSGTTTQEITWTSDQPNTTYSWTANTPSNISGYTASGTSNTIPPQTIVNSGTTTQTLVYTVVPSLGNCEGVPITFAIEIEPAPSITQQPNSQTVCLDSPVIPLTVAWQGTGTPTFEWYSSSSSTGSWTPLGVNSNTYTPPSNALGTMYYYCEISFTTGGCDQLTSDIVGIEVVSGLQIDTQPVPTETICIGGENSLFSVTITGGTGNAAYQWYSNTSNSNSGGTIIAGATNNTYLAPAFNTAGDYYFYVEVSMASSGCGSLTSDVAHIEVVNDPIISNQPLPLQEFCQGASAIPLEVTVGGGVGVAYTYQWYSNTANNTTTGVPISGATNSTYTPPGDIVGTFYYYCVITQPVSGCEVTSDSAQVIVSEAPLINQQPVGQTICLGDALDTLTVSYTNGTGTPTYQWYVNDTADFDTPTTIGTNAPTLAPSGATVGTFYYYCSLTFSSGGCGEIFSDIVEITINQVPVISNYSDLICSDNTFTISPNSSNGDIIPANTTYTWTMPAISPSGSVTGASAESTPQTTISQHLINSTTNPATVTYTVTPTSGICAGIPFTVTVTVNPSISVNVQTTDITCYQDANGSITINISGGIPFGTGDPYNVTWAGPNSFTSNQENISNLQPGEYTLTINDAGGCPYENTFTILEPQELVLQSIDQYNHITCFGDNDGAIAVTIAGGTLGYTYSWTKDSFFFSNLEDIDSLEPGIYQLTVTDANMCTLVLDPMEIEEPELLTVQLENQTNVECFGDNTGAISILVQGGRTDYSFAWTGPDGFTATTQNITSLYAGVYTVVVTDSSGCTETLAVTISQNDEITIQYTATEIRCDGDNDASIIIDNISGGISPYEIAWSNFGSGTEQYNLSPGTYTITITDALNCSRDFDVVIAAPPIFRIDPLVNQISCFGENDASIQLNLQGGVQPVTVQWADDPAAGVERNNLAPGTYSVVITDSSLPLPSCTIQQDFVIYDVLPLQISAVTTDALDCLEVNSGAINLSITGGTIASGSNYQIVWSNNATTEDLNNIGPGTYYVTVTDDNGCEITGEWEIIRFEPLELTIEVNTDYNCETREVNQTFQAVAQGGVPGYTYSWSSGTITGANNEYMQTELNGLVNVEVTDSYGCSQSISYNVDIPELGFPGFSVESIAYTSYGIYSVQDPIQFTNEATGDFIGIVWDFGDGTFSNEENPIHVYPEEGSYIITQTVTYDFGCEYTHVITLQIEKGYDLIFPNAFTPNEDGLNDFFTPKYIGLNSLQLNVYDTWGSLIYSENGEDHIQGWDGKLKNRYAENGNYYYTFSAKTFYGLQLEREGAFTYIK
ncbi:MAG: PKD domain-containing protein [Flavobacteriaceae bacterium]